MIYDIAIVGAGPAGVSAAVNAKILGKRVVWLGEDIRESDAARAEKIDNYIGMPGVSGKELSEAFSSHAEAFGMKPSPERVTGVYGAGGEFTLLAGDESFDARSVILCLGARSASTTTGETEYVGRGISYCATCDGALYRGKTIGVCLTDKRYENEAKFLCRLAAKAYLFPLYKDCGISGDNIEIILKKPTSYVGGMKLEKVCYSGGERNVDGMFLLKNAYPSASMVSGLETVEGHVKVSHDMSTNIEGLFAAGDCTGRPYQYAKAVGEGNTAAHSASEYVDSL